jgi:hypothetical protein
MNFYDVFLVYKRSNRDKVKFRSTVSVNSAFRIRVSLLAQAMNIFCPYQNFTIVGTSAKFTKLVKIHIT